MAATRPPKSSGDNPPAEELQLDMFLGDLFTPVATKDDIDSMEHPLFSIKKKGDSKVRRYVNGKYFVEVTPSVKGAATIWDKDMILYLCSLMRQCLDRGQTLQETFEINAANVLDATRRDKSGRGYLSLYEMLDRLKGTTITTNLPSSAEGSNEESAHRTFGILEEAEVLRDKRSKRLTRLLITPSRWLRNQVKNEHLLTIDPSYFDIESGLERRLYELARKHCGAQAQWKISLKLLHTKVGSDRQMKKFRFDIRKMTLEDELGFKRIINYLFVMTEDDMVHVFNDDGRGHSLLTELLTKKKLPKLKMVRDNTRKAAEAKQELIDD